MKPKIFGLLLVLLLISAGTPLLVSGREAHMTLLAITGEDEKLKGDTADLHLEIKRGDGNVYMDTVPLTQLDTQISIRFAKEVACDYLDKVDCSRYDFYYRIRSDSVIIGGPSAGASLTMLTIATLKNWDLDEDASITGTINPGGFIGLVGGISQKLEAASDSGLNKVLVPKGAMEQGMSKNNTAVWNINNTGEQEENITELAKEKGIEIVEVTTLDEVVYEFTGKKFERERIEINADKTYSNIMQEINDGLCARTEKLLNNTTQKNSSEYSSALNLSQRAKSALENNALYSSASFCFGANLRLGYLAFLRKNLTSEDIEEEIKSLSSNLTQVNDKVSGDTKSTINDLQTYMIVKERLLEASNYLNTSQQNLNQNQTENALNNLAYANERLKSAKLWYKFMKRSGKVFEINEETLKSSCIQKLSEAEERLQYASLYLPSGMVETREMLDQAYQDKASSEYELCLFRASKAKAEADLLLGSIGLTKKSASDYIDIKLRLIEEIIKRQQENDIFPILGYSYYEYAKSLRESDPFSALMYAEYAIELSKLDLYFKDIESKPRLNFYINYEVTAYFLVGAIFGAILMFSFYPLFNKPTSKDNSVKIRIKRD
ncbi:MAG: S16 family serine protease [Candidatus Nanoarchaeia archaeon]